MSAYVRYDREVDVLYVDLRDRQPADVARTIELGGGRQVDYDRAGNALGVEFVAASRGVDLEGVPDAEEVREALRSVAGFAAA